MKKQFLVPSIILFFVSVAIISCGESEKKADKAPSEIKTETYQCPMKCTEQTFEKPGKCPVCGMELEKIIKS